MATECPFFDPEDPYGTGDFEGYEEGEEPLTNCEGSVDDAGMVHCEHYIGSWLDSPEYFYDDPEGFHFDNPIFYSYLSALDTLRQVTFEVFRVLELWPDTAAEISELDEFEADDRRVEAVKALSALIPDLPDWFIYFIHWHSTAAYMVHYGERLDGMNYYPGQEQRDGPQGMPPWDCPDVVTVCEDVNESYAEGLTVAIYARDPSEGLRCINQQIAEKLRDVQNVTLRLALLPRQHPLEGRVVESDLLNRVAVELADVLCNHNGGGRTQATQPPRNGD